jgi:predicted nucleic acid-binding protein
MSRVFVDASYLIALQISGDNNHAIANQHWQQLKKSPSSLITTSFILDEVVTHLNSRDFHASAVQIGDELLTSILFGFVEVDTLILRTGWQYFKQHRDKRYSLTDCISFVVMQELGIRTALTFDRHFAQAGFVMAP